MAKPFRLEREMLNAFERAASTMHTMREVYSLCMREALAAIVPIIREAYADPRSGRGDPSIHLYLDVPFYSHDDEFYNPQYFGMHFREQTAEFDGGCFELHVVLTTTSKLEIKLIREERKCHITHCVWDARWFVQEVANRTRREILFSTDWFRRGEIPDEAQSFRVYPEKKKKKKDSSPETTVS